MLWCGHETHPYHVPQDQSLQGPVTHCWWLASCPLHLARHGLPLAVGAAWLAEEG